MMPNTRWNRWVLPECPFGEVSCEFYILAIEDDQHGFRIKIVDWSDSTKQLLIDFQQSVVLCKITEEIITINFVCDVKKNYGDEFSSGWALFKTTHSQDNLDEELPGVPLKGSLKRFLFLDVDYGIDVVSLCEPIISWIQHENK